MSTSRPVISNIGPVQNLELSQGATFGPIESVLRNPVPAGSPPGTLGAPIDLTGCAIRGQIRRTPLSADPPVAQFDVVLAADRTTGAFSWGLTATATAAIPAANALGDAEALYAYDIELEDSLGRVLRVLRGEVRVLAEVTR